MSTRKAWNHVRDLFFATPKPRRQVDLVYTPNARLRDLRHKMVPGQHTHTPSVMKPAKPFVVAYRTETRGHLRIKKRMPHMKKTRMPVQLLAGRTGMESPMNVLPDGSVRPLRLPSVTQMIRHKDLKKAETLGGLEPLVLNTHAKKLSHHGKLLRHALFGQLYRLKAQSLKDEMHDYYDPHSEGSATPELTAGTEEKLIGSASKPKDQARMVAEREKLLQIESGPTPSSTPA